MKITTSGALAGLLLALAPATALAGPTVSVRVEGKDRTLLERTVVTLPDTPPPVTGCPAGTAGAALEEATKGNWDQNSFTQTILGESHTFTNRDYWAEWVDRGNGYRLGNGICTDVLSPGDELLMLADFSNASFGPTVFPLALENVPATGQAGGSVTVVVTQYVSASGDPGTGERTLVEGATVSGGGERATSGPDGKATLKLVQSGTVTIKASKDGAAPSPAASLTVTAAPAAPTTAPDQPVSAPPAVLPVAAPSTPTAPADTRAPRVALARLRTGATVAARRAPRLLRGTVSDASGVRAVELSIVRRSAGRCAYWSAQAERFQGKRCNGTQPAFSVGTGPRWSYLLPSRLGPGRYYIRVTAVDDAGNRAGTRVVIRVR